MNFVVIFYLQDVGIIQRQCQGWFIIKTFFSNYLQGVECVSVSSEIIMTRSYFSHIWTFKQQLRFRLIFSGAQCSILSDFWYLIVFNEGLQGDKNSSEQTLKSVRNFEFWRDI